MNQSFNTKKITTIAMMTAMAIIVNQFIQFPLVPAVTYLSYDCKDIIIVIGGFIFGPMASLIMSAICSVFDVILRGGNILDIVMNMISTCTFACTAAYIYKRNHTRKGAYIGLVAGIVVMTASMTIWNYIVTPFYYQMPVSAVVVLLPWIALFNFLKSLINAVVTMVIYKPVVRALRQSNLIPDTSEVQKASTKDWLIVAIFIVITIVLAVFVR